MDSSVYIPKYEICIALIILFLTGSAESATLIVDDSGGANYLKIQDAINASTDGDSILVYSGTYYENVNISKQLILRGIDNGGGKPVVDAGSILIGIEIRASGVTLDGFNSTNSTKNIFVNSSNNIIINNNASFYFANSNNNILSDNFAAGGIYLQYSNNNIINRNIANKANFGIHLVYSNNNTLNRNAASINRDYAIYLGGSNNNTLIDNYALSSIGYEWRQITNGVWYKYNIGKGIYLTNSHNNMLKGNNVSFNNLYGIYFYNSDNNMLIGNNASSNEGTGIYLINSDNNRMSGNNLMGSNLLGDIGISLSNSDNITLSYNNVSHFDTGIILRYSNQSLIGNKVEENQEGILLSYSNNSKLIENNVSNNFDGIHLIFSRNNTLDGNIVSNNRRSGIVQQSSSNNTIIGNNVNSNSHIGIYLGYCNLCLYSTTYGSYYSNYIPSNNNTMSDNIVSNNNFGIYLESFEQNYSNNNMIYHNNIITNTNQSHDNSHFNSWDSGYPSGGNYWTDYPGVDLKSGPNQNTPGSDCIGDIPYNINGGAGAQDRYPLMNILVSSKTGDINGDGQLTLVDAIYLAKHVGDFGGYETIYADGDINANGKVTLVDAIYLAKHVGGFIGYENLY